MKILLKVQTRLARPRPRRQFLELLQRAAELSGLAAQAGANDELAIVLLGARRMRQVNRDYLGHDRLTDVIAFDWRDGTTGAVADQGLSLGEILVSPTAALANADEFGSSPAAELLLYIVHGMLHLAGLRDKTASQRATMRAAEARVLEGLAILGDPDSWFQFKSGNCSGSPVIGGRLTRTATRTADDSRHS